MKTCNQFVFEHYKGCSSCSRQEKRFFKHLTSFLHTEKEDSYKIFAKFRMILNCSLTEDSYQLVTFLNKHFSNKVWIFLDKHEQYHVISFMALQSGSQAVKSNKSAALPHEGWRGKSPIAIMSKMILPYFCFKMLLSSILGT